MLFVKSTLPVSVLFETLKLFMLNVVMNEVGFSLRFIIFPAVFHFYAFLICLVFVVMLFLLQY